MWQITTIESYIIFSGILYDVTGRFMVGILSTRSKTANYTV